MNRWRNSLHFRLGVLYLGVFSISVVLLGFIISLTTQKFLMNQLMNYVESGTNHLLGDYNQDGLDELRHDIKERLDSEDPERLWYVLGRPDGKTEFDPIERLPERGWQRMEEEGHNLLVLVTPLKDGYTLGVGIAIDRVHAVEKALQRTFIFAIVATLLLGSLGGYFVSRGFLKRLEHIKKITKSFGEGDLTLRLPAEKEGDEFDQLSASLNRMFERIENLVSEVQRVTSNIAHDLRTPLGRIKQKLDALHSHTELTPAAQVALENISEDLEATLQTFSALLRIAEVELGTRKTGFRDFDLDEVVEQINSAYAAVMEDSGRSLQVQSSPGSLVFGDQILVTQALANLVENALQHTPEASVIQIHVLREGRYLSLSVEDNGKGLDDALIEQVTKPFFKADPTRGRWGGSGLGLSLVAAVAKLHEAELRLENLDPGFRVQLRFASPGLP